MAGAPQSVRESVIGAAEDLVALWVSPCIRQLPRAERNAAIEECRRRLIDVVTLWEREKR